MLLRKSSNVSLTYAIRWNTALASCGASKNQTACIRPRSHTRASFIECSNSCPIPNMNIKDDESDVVTGYMIILPCHLCRCCSRNRASDACSRTLCGTKTGLAPHVVEHAALSHNVSSTTLLRVFEMFFCLTELQAEKGSIPDQQKQKYWRCFSNILNEEKPCQQHHLYAHSLITQMEDRNCHRDK
eukprot:SAG31_NODE_3803_length_3868_cov_6.379146_3_plen_186_part_00